MENCYWFADAVYVVWIFNYSIKAIGIPCLRHMRQIASPEYHLPLFQISRWFLQIMYIKSTLYIYRHTRAPFLEEHKLDQSTISSFYLSIRSAFLPMLRTKKCKKMYEAITARLRWEGTFGDCLIQLPYLSRITNSRLLRTWFSQVLNISKVGESVSLRNPFQCLTTLTVQKFFSYV